MHFTYKDDEEGESDDLMQGDILSRSEELMTVIKEYHPYYANNKYNTHFLILTQSCDLVRRNGQGCSSKYINLAAVRPLSFFLDRVLSELGNKKFSFDFPVCSDRERNKLNELLQRLINNNESEYFFLKSESSKKFPEDSCAFLKLSIAIYANEHYDKCLRSRLLQLKQPYQAKLGWAIGNMYSRVGTDDWPKEKQKVFIKGVVNDLKVYWLAQKDEASLKRLVEKYITDNPGMTIDANVLDSLVDEIPSKKSKAIKKISELVKSDKKIVDLISNGNLTEDEVDRLLRTLESDIVLTSYLRD